jgi:alpha-ketoglutarate-dependent taurine dioxygenase
MSSDLRVVKLSENIGARVDGVRLGELDAETAAAINQTLAQHKVLLSAVRITSTTNRTSPSRRAWVSPRRRTPP